MDDSRPGRALQLDDAVLIRIPDAARLLSVSRSRAYLLAKRGDLPGAIRLGGTWRVNRRVLAAWVDEAVARGATPDSGDGATTGLTRPQGMAPHDDGTMQGTSPRGFPLTDKTGTTPSVVLETESRLRALGSPPMCAIWLEWSDAQGGHQAGELEGHLLQDNRSLDQRILTASRALLTFDLLGSNVSIRFDPEGELRAILGSATHVEWLAAVGIAGTAVDFDVDAP